MVKEFFRCRLLSKVILLFIFTIFMSQGAVYASLDGHEDMAHLEQVKADSVAAKSAHRDESYHDKSIPMLWWLAPLGAVCALIFVRKFYKEVMGYPEGDKKMVEIAGHVREGAYAYLKQQYKVVAIFFIFVFLALAALSFGLKIQSNFVPFAFLTSGFLSGLAGYLGMKMATNASARTTEGAKKSLDQGLKIAFRSGAVMGLIVVGLGLLDVSIWFFFLRKFTDVSLTEIAVILPCFGMGASFQALFARVGGGIFTKAADVGADLVGKVEAGIPEDDPRNPATIADNVGDNVGDVAGMGADLYESYYASILASAALGVACGLGVAGLVLPMCIAGIGIILSIFGIRVIKTKEGATQKELLKSLSKGVNLSSILIVIASAVIIKFLLPGHFGIWGSIVTGLIAGILIGKGTEYFTSADHGPTKGIAAQAETGSATLIIDGVATGMLSTIIPVTTIAVAIILSFMFAGGFSNTSMGLYGIAIAAVGMLSTLGITLATDAYGPIADNAGGNAEMSEQEPIVRERTDALDSLGNTTAATGKGFAIGSAALTAMALLAVYVEEVKIGLERTGVHAVEIAGRMVDTTSLQIADLMSYYKVTLMNPKVLVGLFLGSMVSFVFCALTMKAVGRAAAQMVAEVRRQFKEIAGIMDGTGQPDYASCVAISTKGAQKEMMLPSLLAIFIPIAVGLVLGVPGSMGLLAGGLSTGFLLAIFMANAGGAWDNAKKYIETGQHGGKGSDAHKAAVVGDTVGDPFKDTSGPSLNILIKLMSIVSVVFAGLIVKFSPKIGELLHIMTK
ncbi:vacuolar-typeH(+)-translocating inorganic pyrophosphatase [Candidatus Scalindua japonica]|uniref:Putative K(+)-stimulated pyrophosphate-energized sodium pump n=2 Tax=Candidatus Scalindua japonica TaxID=1284222 RepID=A0A286U2H3_9BACT|nr:sodium-translocating pyrophosphatase [Candidatus Scalindua japonica]GAX62327.1 vacuolar-typeH(+)-translocating inorganic pyrophosphatase [Candidatus Scalindua japonica]